MTLSMSPAAVCQCFTLVSLCTSIADPNWIQVRNSSDPSGKQLIYGVAFTLHAAQNLTDTGPLGGVSGWGMWMLYALAALCYSAVLISSSSFLLDFLGGGVSYPRLVVSLHVSTVALLLCSLGVCGTCLYIIHHNLQDGKQWWWDWGLRGARAGPGGGHPSRDEGRGIWGGVAAGMRPYPGESFYIAGLALLFSGAASVISIKGLGDIPPAHTPRGYTAVDEEEEEEVGEVEGEEVGEVEGEEEGEVEGEGENSDIEPLPPRQPVPGAERGEEWRVEFPE